MTAKIKATILIAGSILLISGTIDLSNLFNYSNQSIPTYILKDNTPSTNPITDEGATLGRVLFYDKKLSSNNTISCSSCHKQEFAFSDSAQFSQGINGQTLRHSMRLINARFADETKFFWDERASSLEDQTTEPIKDHIEMGYSGTSGDSTFQDLINKLATTTYYPKLFNKAFGNTIISEQRISKALAQFIRSIQSFDSKYDTGRVQVVNHSTNFPNYTANENAGKTLFTDSFTYVVQTETIPQFGGSITATVAKRTSGGFNCASCHRPPEFDIDPQSLNNGFDRPLNGNLITQREFTNTRSATLRDLMNPNGTINGPMFHGGTTSNLGGGIVANYNFKELDSTNTNLDPRLAPGGYPLYLNITNQEKNQLVDFLETLTGNDVYSNPKWSDPFDQFGNITVNDNSLSIFNPQSNPNQIKLFPNPVLNEFTLSGNLELYTFKLFNSVGQISKTFKPIGISYSIDISTFPSGIYFVKVIDIKNAQVEIHKLIKQ
ncbi:MAG: Cytochrome c551 peroxidase [Cryomorphaceae bacterium]|nr:MAG: Cytochrome c551 peroxidase [Cryomorphaceae bacterium]